MKKYRGVIKVNRTKKLKMNTNMSLLHRLITIVSGLILPRLILIYFGSEINGLASSIAQFLGVITFLDLGLGSVVQTALYRPLAKEDNKQLSSVLISAKSYFQKIAYILIIYVLILIIFYPLMIESRYGYFSTGILIFSMSISHFARYYVGIVNELLLGANQQDYVQLGSEIVVVILNLLVSIFLINIGATIEIVQLGSGLVYLFRPLFLAYYVNKHFNINYDMELKENPLPQKWHGMGQHIAYSIQNGTDIVILTIFSTLENVSVYTIYNLIISAIKSVIHSLTTGIRSFFGDLYANDEIVLLNKYFDKAEWVIHSIVVYLYGMTIILINSFVMLYTSGVYDISYKAPLFSFLLVLSGAIYSLKIPYQVMISSAGHFKQTQVSAFIEAGLNIIISIILVNRLGLVGVVLGTLVSTAYRTVCLVIYLSKNITLRPIQKFVKHIFVDFISLGAIIGIGIVMTNIYQIETLIDWLLVAVILGLISLILLSIINFLFYKEIMITTIRGVLRRN